MTDNVTIQFSTANESDLPRIGHAKRVRVNGRIETLYVREVKIKAQRYIGARKPHFAGTATLTTRAGMTNWMI